MQKITPSWSERFLDLSEYISRWSKDPHTKTCAIITSANNHRIISVGWNSFPSGCDDTVQSRYERPEKYLWMEHAERDAIYCAASNGVNLNGATMYLRWFPCADCARAIIQSGIKKVVCEKPDITDERWGDSFRVALQMFTECSIFLEIVPYDN